MRRRVAWLLPALLLLIPLPFLRRATGTDMDPSIRPGDILLVLPLRPRPGDVVLLPDPGEPTRKVLRRVHATPLTWGRGAVDGARLREMGREDATLVLSEDDHHLVREEAEARREPQRGAEGNPGTIFVLADNRALALDSRTWGPQPESAVEGVVLLRLGTADAWRGWVGWRAADGPWLPPSRQGG